MEKRPVKPLVERTLRERFTAHLVVRRARTEAYIVPAVTLGPAVDFLASVGWWGAREAKDGWFYLPRLLTGRLLYPTVSQHASAKRVSRQVWFLQDKARLFRPLPFDENDGAAFVPHRLAKRYTFDFDGAFTVHEGAFPSSIPTMIVAGNTNSRAQAPSSWTA